MFLEEIDGKIILFPVSTTEEYFKRLSSGKSGIFSGVKGTGKSFAFFTYSYLTNFKVKYLITANGSKNELLLYGQNYVWKTVNQICYINLKD